MRIGIEAQRIFRKKKHGMDIVALELIRALQKADHENSYFIFVKKGEDSQCLSETSNFRIVEVPGFSYADWEQIFLPVYCRLYRLDLLHCTSNTAPLAGAAPSVITLHDVIFLENKNKAGELSNIYQQLGRIYRKYVVPACVRRAAQIITVSEYEKDRINEKLQLNADKISVVYNAFGKHFSRNEDPAQKELIRRKYALPEAYLFFIGNTDPKKNMLHTFTAYAQYADSAEQPLPLLVADLSAKNLDIIIARAGMERHRAKVQLTGYIQNTDLPLIYGNASIFLYPSLRESFGIPVLESMACGTPVITSNTSALPEVAGNAALLIDPQEPETIAAAIINLLNNQTLREGLIAKGLERVRQFSWDLSALKLMEIYKHTAHGNFTASVQKPVSQVAA